MKKLATLFCLLCLLLSAGCSQTLKVSDPASPEGIPAYSGEPYAELGPAGFTQEEVTGQSFEDYSKLDGLGRVGTATACLGLDTLPTEERGDISEVRPTGWEQADYSFVDGGKLYNRCHLIAYSLAAENANPLNLMTGTRSFNIEGMEPFEREVRGYINQTGNHVMYRVTPYFTGENLLADGVKMEALSVEDSGAGINRSIYCYNAEPGVTIDYATGASAGSGETPESGPAEEESAGGGAYVLNTSSRKIHLPDCPSASGMNPANREESSLSIEELEAQGYTCCGSCHPEVA